MSAETDISEILDYVRSTGTKPATLARRAGLHPNALRGLLKDNWNPTLGTLLKIKAAIQGEGPAPSQRGAA